MRTGMAMAMLAAIWAFGVVSPAPGSTRLLANTVLAMGGANNTTGLLMDFELDGYLSGIAGTPYEGYEFQTVPWSAQVTSYVVLGMTWNQSQSEGVSALDRAIDRVEGGSKVIAFGHSASASVIVKELRALQDRRDQGLPVPSIDDVSFIVIGNPNRPNGGLFSRLAGFYLPFPVGMTFDGSNPETDYQLLDISWEYDPISDLPVHPFNVLADLNAFVAMLTRHSFYYDADPADSSAVLSDVISGNTRYLTLKRDHLPILEPFYLIGVFNPILDAVEPALRYVIDLAYDRTVGPEVSRPLQWTPVRRDPDQVAEGFLKALGGADVSVPDPIAAPMVGRLATAPALATPPARAIIEMRQPSVKPPRLPARASATQSRDRSVGHPRGQPAQRPESSKPVSADPVSADDVS